jgi:cell division inhibitor SepF
VSIYNKIKDILGLNDYEYDEDDDTDDGAYSGSYQQPEPQIAQPVAEEERRTPRRATADTRTAAKISNVVGMPGIMNGVSEMILIEPRSFEEMPQVIDALRSRKSVILNMTLIRQEEAQRSVDFVSGGTYAIDGHYERIGDNIFLFTPNCVQVSTPANVVNEVANQQSPVAQTPRASRVQSSPIWNSDSIQAAQ